MTELETLVKAWRDAQKDIDNTSVEKRRQDREPLDRLVAAHNALTKYADENLA